MIKHYLNIFLTTLLLTLSAHAQPSSYTVDSVKSTVGIGSDFCFSHPLMVRANIYATILKSPINPFELEVDFSTLSFVRDNKQLRISYENFFVGPAAYMVLLLSEAHSPFFLYVMMFPQVIGNFKVYYPLIKDGIHIYIGENTDYYLYPGDSRVYTESKAGIKLFAGPIAVDCAICKPWFKGYLKSNDFYISSHLSWYVSRKKKYKDNNYEAILHKVLKKRVDENKAKETKSEDQ